MSKKFLVPIDLNQLELQNASLQNLATAPSNPVAGQVYFNTATKKAMVWNGTAWVAWEADTTVSPATTAPKMDGTAEVGTSAKYAREDHVHPKDTSKADKSSTVTNVAYNTSTRKIQKTINGSTTDVVTLAKVATSGAYGDLSGTPAIPENTSDLTNDSDFVSDANYVHTDNNFTTTLKDKLTGIASGAEVNVQADWNVTDSSSDAYIKNKPNIPEGVSVDTALSTTSENPVQNKVITTALNGKAANTDYVGATASAAGTHGLVPAAAASDTSAFLMSDGLWYTLSLRNDAGGETVYSLVLNKKTGDGSSVKVAGHAFSMADTNNAGMMSANMYKKLAGIATGAEVNVQSDWSATSGDAFIKNKPTLGAAAAKGVDTSVTEGTTSANLPTSAAVVNYVSSVVGAADAMRFKGTIGTGGTVTALPASHQQGDTYRVITAGTYAGQSCEIGDLIIAMGTSGTTASDWTVAQTNIDGAITSISSGTGISVTGSGASRTVALASGVATAGSVGDTTNQTPAFGGTFKAISQTIDTYGRTTATAEHTVKIPSLPTASTSAAGIVQLNNTVTSTSTAQAATANAVKTAYDKGAEALAAAEANAILTQTRTIAAGDTSVTSAVKRSQFIGYKAYIGDDEVVVDAAISSSGCTFSIASAIASAITIIIQYINL